MTGSPQAQLDKQKIPALDVFVASQLHSRLSITNSQLNDLHLIACDDHHDAYYNHDDACMFAVHVCPRTLLHCAE